MNPDLELLSPAEKYDEPAAGFPVETSWHMQGKQRL